MASIRKRAWTTSKGEGRSAWVVDFVDTAGNRDRRQFDTKREADASRVEVEGHLRAGRFHPEANKVTVKQAAESFVEHCRDRMDRGEKMTRSSFVSYQGHVREHILHAEHGIGALKLSQLTTGRVGKFRDALRDAGVSIPTTRKILGTVKSLMEDAKGQDLIAVNAARGVRVIGRSDEGSRKVAPPSKDAMRAILKAAEPAFGFRIRFAAATAVRASEMQALRWKHVDLLNGEVRIETCVDRWRTEDTTKSEAGMRTIPLGAAIVTVLKAWRLQSRFSREEDLLFPNKWGRYENHENMSAKRWRPTLKRAGVSGLTWHGLRHFGISCWIERRLSPKTVQTFAGHKRLQVTMDRYGHLFPSEDHSVVMDHIADELFG